MQVKSQRTELLKHPLVYNLIEHKWDKFGRPIFYMLLICHIAFVIFLTAFALELLNPFSPTCMYVCISYRSIKFFMCEFFMLSQELGTKFWLLNNY